MLTSQVFADSYHKLFASYLTQTMKNLSSVVLTIAATFCLSSYTPARELDAHDYRILAQETAGQCASPGGIGGCKYDSNETYYPEGY